MRKIFEADYEIETYTYSMIKTAISILIIIILCNRGEIISISNKLGNILITIISLVIGVACIWCIYMSVDEMTELHDRRVAAKRDVAKLNVKEYTVDEIVEIVEREDVAEIEIRVDNKIINIGAASDTKPSSSVFFDKCYFCEKQEYEAIEDFRNAIIPYSNDGVIEVVSIDGIL